MAEEKGVLVIPASPFFSEERAIQGASDDFVRIAFCKQDDTIESAAAALFGVTGDTLVNGEASSVLVDDEVNVR